MRRRLLCIAPDDTYPAALMNDALRGWELCCVRAHVGRVARVDAPVLIWGESGSGKELTAQAIHAQSARASRPFVAVNCGAMAPNLIQSELFGHERGAFTGATRAKAGPIESAHGGTLFLDEIGDLPRDLQAGAGARTFPSRHSLVAHLPHRWGVHVPKSAKSHTTTRIHLTLMWNGYRIVTNCN
jgi:hypothetical protein